MMNQEIQTKLQRVRGLLRHKELYGALMRTRSQFAWITGGGNNAVGTASEVGAAAILVTRDKAYCISSNIESRRMAQEQTDPAIFEPVDFPWHEAAEASVLQKITGGKPIGCDAGEGINVKADLTALQTPLLEEEVERYLALGRLTSLGIETVCRGIAPGMTESDVAAMVHGRFVAAKARVPVCLVAADERIDRRRHPYPVGNVIRGRAMVVVGVEAGGLVCSATRLVSFGPPTEELNRRHRAVCAVDAAAIAASRPGATLGEVFAAIVQAYADQGYADEWKLHHQGGPTGYGSRRAIANFNSAYRLQAMEACAWNPSITGAKSEDTILLTDDGIRMITQPRDGWPVMDIRRPEGTFRRADILVLT